MRKLALCALLAALPLTASAVAAAQPPPAVQPPLPAEDSFYRYDGALADIAPGAVLRTRQVSAALPGAATQALYRTTDQLGRPAVTAALIVRPPGAAGAPRLVSYQAAYDALSSRCNPSYATAFGPPGLDHAVLTAALAAGYSVVTADYEGTGLHYGAGHESGYGTLDGIRAAEQVLDVAPGVTPVALLGFSGGGLATQFAAELAARYAPELRIVGAVEGGLPVNFLHTIDYIDGSPVWSKVLPLVLTGISRGFEVDLTPYLSPYGTQIMARAADLCALEAQALPVIEMRSLFAPEYADYHRFSPLTDMTGALVMGTVGTPRFPMLIAFGISDGIGDGVALAEDQRSLARTLCAGGAPVEVREYAGLDHVAAGLAALAAGMPYIADRFAGVPPVNTCVAPSGN
ncbi:lipase family protein [Nocardia sp. NPDC057668]|uniref:lipase family protein n=1 Tax=Nocardia sp. NPDC057668 TaxID=3346202 RepID=UPI00366C33D4